jgi:hypothetical protein
MEEDKIQEIGVRMIKMLEKEKKLKNKIPWQKI